MFYVVWLVWCVFWLIGLFGRLVFLFGIDLLKAESLAYEICWRLREKNLYMTSGPWKKAEHFLVSYHVIWWKHVMTRSTCQLDVDRKNALHWPSKNKTHWGPSSPRRWRMRRSPPRQGSGWLLTSRSHQVLYWKILKVLNTFEKAGRTTPKPFLKLFDPTAPKYLTTTPQFVDHLLQKKTKKKHHYDMKEALLKGKKQWIFVPRPCLDPRFAGLSPQLPGIEAPHPDAQQLQMPPGGLDVWDPKNSPGWIGKRKNRRKPLVYSSFFSQVGNL